MKKIIFILIVLSCFSNRETYSQVSFVEFVQPQYGIVLNHGYTFENIQFMCGSHGDGYKIYRDGILVFENCSQFSGRKVISLMFTSSSTGFMVERNLNGVSVYKTGNSGVDWIQIGHGSPLLLGFYLINEHSGYMINWYPQNNSPHIYINRVSDISRISFTDSNVDEDYEINDTIFGNPMCGFDHLDFVINNSGNLINYRINFIVSELYQQSSTNNSELTFYPNPCDDVIFIEGVTCRKDIDIKLMDFQGRVVRILNPFYNQITTADLQSGLYIIDYSFKGKRHTKKIIVK